MNYFSGHWSRLDWRLPCINENFLAFNDTADLIAIALYNNNYLQHSETVKHLLSRCNQLHVYHNEPTGSEDSLDFADFLLANDLDRVNYYADCVLNFELKHAKFITQICWFIDEFNYYCTTNWGPQLLGQLDYTNNKPYKFDMLLGGARPHRDFLFNTYQQNQTIKNNTIATYYKDSMSSGLWPDWANPSLQGVEFSGDLFEINGEPVRCSAVIPVDIYNQTYYSVVAETTYYNRYNHYTEKVAKPILAQRPFIVFAGQYYLKNLKSLGFQTFDSVIDESYDSVSDDLARWKLAVVQMEQLCLANPQKVLAKLRSVLEHNQQHFLSTDWMAPAKQLVSKYTI